MSATTPPRLQAQLQLAYPGFSLDVNLHLASAGVTALVGPSGSGKTSCLRTIAGLERRATGRVVVNGEVWQDDRQGIFMPVHQRALGYVFQDARLFAHLSVAQNLAFGQQRVPAAERRVSLEQAIALLGIAPLLKRQPDTLSGGERQRVAMARALASSPRLLLMDEPLAALDAQRKADILPYLENLQRELDIPVLYVSHAMDEVTRLADHLVLLDAGRVSASGPTQTLLTRLDLPLAHGDAAGAVVPACIASHDNDEHLTQASFAGGTLLLPWQNRPVGQTLKVRIQARDVSLTLARQTGTSIQNILEATVSALSPDSPGQTMVALDVGGCTLLARVTQRSVRQLGLQPGLRLFAQIKGVAILG